MIMSTVSLHIILRRGTFFSNTLKLEQRQLYLTEEQKGKCFRRALAVRLTITVFADTFSSLLIIFELP